MAAAYNLTFGLNVDVTKSKIEQYNRIAKYRAGK
jgi:hypothetical protein